MCNQAKDRVISKAVLLKRDSFFDFKKIYAQVVKRTVILSRLFMLNSLQAFFF